MSIEFEHLHVAERLIHIIKSTVSDDIYNVKTISRSKLARTLQRKPGLFELAEAIVSHFPGIPYGDYGPEAYFEIFLDTPALAEQISLIALVCDVITSYSANPMDFSRQISFSFSDSTGCFIPSEFDLSFHFAMKCLNTNEMPIEENAPACNQQAIPA